MVFSGFRWLESVRFKKGGRVFSTRERSTRGKATEGFFKQRHAIKGGGLSREKFD